MSGFQKKDDILPDVHQYNLVVVCNYAYLHNLETLSGARDDRPSGRFVTVGRLTNVLHVGIRLHRTCTRIELYIYIQRPTERSRSCSCTGINQVFDCMTQISQHKATPTDLRRRWEVAGGFQTHAYETRTCCVHRPRAVVRRTPPASTDHGLVSSPRRRLSAASARSIDRLETAHAPAARQARPACSSTGHSRSLALRSLLSCSEQRMESVYRRRSTATEQYGLFAVRPV